MPTVCQSFRPLSLPTPHKLAVIIILILPMRKRGHEAVKELGPGRRWEVEVWGSDVHISLLCVAASC